MDFHDRLKELRKEKDLYQKELADKLNIGRTTIANYEQGKRFPDKDTLNKIADYFNVSVDYLLGRTNHRQDPNEKITKALEEQPELLDFWEQFKKRESMQLLFKQTRNMSDKSIQDVVNFMKSVEDELDRNNY